MSPLNLELKNKREIYIVPVQTFHQRLLRVPLNAPFAYGASPPSSPSRTVWPLSQCSGSCDGGSDGAARVYSQTSFPKFQLQRIERKFKEPFYIRTIMKTELNN